MLFLVFQNIKCIEFGCRVSEVQLLLDECVAADPDDLSVGNYCGYFLSFCLLSTDSYMVSHFIYKTIHKVKSKQSAVAEILIVRQ